LDNLNKSWEETVERVKRENARKRPGKPKVPVLAIRLGQLFDARYGLLDKLTTYIEQQLRDETVIPDTLLAARLVQAGINPNPPEPPQGLELALWQHGVEVETVALCALTEWLTTHFDDEENNRPGKHGDSDADQRLKIRIGRRLRNELALSGALYSDDKDAKAAVKRLKSGRAYKWDWVYLKHAWTDEDCLRTGDWLLHCAAHALAAVTEDGEPATSADWRRALEVERERLLQRRQVLLPHDHPPSDWTGFHTQYDNRLGADFVSGRGDPVPREAITAAFKKKPLFDHARGVNALQRPPLALDMDMVDLAERFAVQLMKGDRDDNERTVRDAIKVARNPWMAERFWLAYRCDTRGRVYAVHHFNYGRQDFIRAMFKFADGLPLGAEGTEPLEIYCANLAGLDKEPHAERLRWVERNKASLICKIAADPVGTFPIWMKYKRKAFRFVAVCRELAEAWKNPQGFRTHLPIPLDGTANGCQHGALLTRDHVAGERVNLAKNEHPRAPYGDIAELTCKLIDADEGPDADFWRSALGKLDKEQLRDLVKAPGVALSYGIRDSSIADKVKEEYKDITGNAVPERKGGCFNKKTGVKCKCEDWAKEKYGCTQTARYLGDKIREAYEIHLPGPAAMMRTIRQLAKYMAEHGMVIEWTTPTGFPVSNNYRERKIRKVKIFGGVQGSRKDHSIGDGYTTKILKGKCQDSGPPNFVHSMDSSPPNPRGACS
jgi:hypothetical protein